MGSSSSPVELAAKLNAAAAAFADLDTTVVREAAQLTKTTIVAGAPSRLRGVGKRGARLTIGYNVTTSAAAAGSGAAALLFARGPWQFVEHDTGAHRIPRARGRRARARYVVIPGVGPRRSAQHPGTRGTRPFEKGVHRAEPAVGRMFQNRGEAVLRAVF